MFLGAMLLTPIPFALFYQDGMAGFFLASASVSAVVGWLLYRFLDPKGDITYREGFAIVTFGWVVFALFGALPFLLSGTIPDPVDAFFEAMSGFSTTGSTVLKDLEVVPKSILFWRSLTQWLGGMGIIVLSLAILPFLGVGGMQLFEAEVPGPTADRLSPRIQDTAKVLWGVYFLLTFAEACLLWLGEMDLFEASCHSLTTMATGGFSTSDGSLGAFGSYSHVIVTCFMFLAGVNFSLHFFALRGRPGRYLKSQEFRFYLGIVVGATLAIFLFRAADGYPVWLSLRDAAFMTVSIITTTGFGTGDYEVWHTTAQYILITLMFIGGCAGSTGGGIKVVRILLVVKHAYLQLSRLIHPREVRILMLDHKPVSPEVMQSILGFVALFFGLFLHASLLMALLLPTPLHRVTEGVPETEPLVTAGASVIACLGNIGPGLGTVGPTETFSHIPAAGKLVLCACMLLGRLEIFTVLVLFFPSFWRK